MPNNSMLRIIIAFQNHCHQETAKDDNDGLHHHDGDDHHHDAQGGNLILLDPIDTQPSGRHTSILSPTAKPQGNAALYNM